jgi:hypothetical protein
MSLGKDDDVLSTLGEEVRNKPAAEGESLTILVDGKELGGNVVSDVEGKVDGTEDNSVDGEFVGKRVGAVWERRITWTNCIRWTSSRVQQ